MMRDVLEEMAKHLVDNPDKVSVKQTDGDRSSVFELTVASCDLGKVIGKEGRTAAAFRLILVAAGMKLKKRYSLEIME